MPAFDEAFNAAYNTQLRANQLAAERKEREERTAWEREDRASRQAKQRRVDDAMNRVRSMSTDGIVEQGAGDLTAGGIQQVMANGYGSAAGSAAVQELAGDSYRELQRGMRAPGTPTQQATPAHVLGLAQSGPKARKARESEIMGAAGDAMLAAGDMGGWVGMRDKAKSARYSEGLAEGYKRFDQLHSTGQLSGFLDELSQNGGVRGGFSTMKYTVGEGKDAKQVEYLVYDPEGKGAPMRVDIDDARQIFAIRSLMDVDPERAQAELKSLKGEQRKLAMQMLDIQFKGAGMRNDVSKSVHSADMEVKGHSLRERAFEEDSKLRRQGLNLQREGLNMRRTELDRTHPTMSPADRTALMDIEKQWYAETDPTKKAALERQYQMVTSRAALNMGKVLGLPSGRGSVVPKEEDVISWVERLQADPRNKDVPVQKLRAMAVDMMRGSGGGLPDAYGNPELGKPEPSETHTPPPLRGQAPQAPPGGIPTYGGGAHGRGTYEYERAAEELRRQRSITYDPLGSPYPRQFGVVR